MGMMQGMMSGRMMSEMGMHPVCAQTVKGGMMGGQRMMSGAGMMQGGMMGMIGGQM
jgi:hypothetical protein